MRSLWQRISARERGFTVVELTVVAALLLLVTSSMLAVFASAQRSSAFAQERAHTLDAMRSTMSRMTKEIRQAEAIDPSSDADTLQIDTYVLGTAKTIRFEAVGTQLRRVDVGAGSTTVLQEDLDSASIFTYTLPTGTSPVGDATVITLSLNVQPERLPETVVTLTSEVRLRNVGGIA